MSEETTAAEGGLTRREMLKKSALVGAVAWTIPIVGSFNAPAFGQVTSPPCDCSGPNCAFADDCGGVGTPCNCLTTVEGDCFCHNFSPCSGLQTCTASGECPTGWACVDNTCCGAIKICVPPCGFSVGADDGGPYTGPA